MSLGLLRLAVSRLVISASTCHSCRASPWSGFSSSTDSLGDDQQKHSRKPEPRSRVTFNSIGRKIGPRRIRLLGEDGQELGTMHRADVIRLMDQTELKLVAIDDMSEPPLYRLMKGKQIHQEQMKLRETRKAKTAAVQSKELSFSAGISQHDLDTKLRQVVSWLEKNHHVRLTIKAGSDSGTALDRVLSDMMEKISVPVAFVSKPCVVRGGRAAMCVLRLASAASDTPASTSKESPHEHQ